MGKKMGLVELRSVGVFFINFIDCNENTPYLKMQLKF